MDADHANVARRYGRLLARHSWVVLLGMLLAGAIGLGGSLAMVPVYQATTTLLVDEAPGTGDGAAYNAILTSERRARTYVQMLETDPLLTTVIDQLKLPFTSRELRRMLSVQPVRDTQLITVQVRDTDPGRAAAIANTLASTFGQQTLQLQTTRYAASKASLQQQMTTVAEQIEHNEAALAAAGPTPSADPERERLARALDQYRQSYAGLVQSFEQVRLAEAQATANVVPIDPAAIPDRSVAPRTLPNTALALVAGLLLALGLVLLRDVLDARVYDSSEIPPLAGAPLVGTIRHGRMAHQLTSIVAEQPGSAAAEAYRALRTNLEFAGAQQPAKLMLVTSSAPHEGTSTVVVNLATALAHSGHSVILVDANLRQPRLHTWAKTTAAYGLSELLLDPALDASACLATTPVPNVKLLAGGQPPAYPAELVGVARMGELLAQLAAQADVVLIDTPPVTMVTDAAVIARHVDGVLLVTQLGLARRAAIHAAAMQLLQIGARLCGVVAIDGGPRGLWGVRLAGVRRDAQPQPQVTAGAPQPTPKQPTHKGAKLPAQVAAAKAAPAKGRRNPARRSDRPVVSNSK